VNCSLQEDSSKYSIAKNLREIAFEFNITILLRCRLSVRLERRRYRYPITNDLKRYAHFMNAAEQVLVLNEPNVYYYGDQSENHWELILLKNRIGLCSSQYFTDSVSAVFHDDPN
jgi:replicative DNA helicase